MKRPSSTKANQSPIMSGSATWHQPKSLKARAKRRLQHRDPDLDQPVALFPYPPGRSKPLTQMPEALRRLCVGVGQ